MFALKSAFLGRKARRSAELPVELGSPEARAANAARGGIVLPRLLRRPLRLAARFVSDGPEAPRYAATILSLSLIGAFAAYGAVLGGHVPIALQAVTAHTGFAVEEIKISGHRETSEIDILGELGLDGWTSLIGFDAETARGRIAGLPWVEGVSVRKSYPSTLEIRLVEREPYAIWQSGSKLSLVEKSGNVIVAYPGGRFASLPLIVGMGAPEHAPEIISMAARIPEIAERAKAFVRVSDRRWNLQLDNGVAIKLPAQGVVQALNDLGELDRDGSLLSRDIVAIDMRMADRLIVELTSQAATDRKAALEELEKARRREKRT